MTDKLATLTEKRVADASGQMQTPLLLSACSMEADRLVRSLKAFDRAMASCLSERSSISGVMQSLDLICQEAEGLAGVLQLIAGSDQGDHHGDPESMIHVLKMQAQRDRVRAVLGPVGPDIPIQPMFPS